MFLADGELDGRHLRPEGRHKTVQSPLERGSLPVDLVHEDGPGDTGLGGHLPHHLGLHLNAVDGRDHEEADVGGPEGTLHVPYEVRVSRRVHDVDLDAAPLDGDQ